MINFPSKPLTSQVRHFREPHGREYDICQVMFLHHLDSRHLEHEVEADVVSEGNSEVGGEHAQIWLQGGRACELAE